MKQIFLLIIISIALFACKKQEIATNLVKNDKTEQCADSQTVRIVNISKQDSNKSASNNSPDSLKGFLCSVYQDFHIPLPSQLFITDDNANIDSLQLLPLDDVDRLTNSYQKSLALGMLSADLVYLTIHGQSALMDNYYAKISKLSNELDIPGVFTSEEYKFIRANPGQDTIIIIIDHAIDKMCSILTENKIYSQLPFIVYGAWTESLHLIIRTLQSAPENNDKADLLEILNKQSEVINNLKKFYNDILVDVDEYQINLNIQTILGDLDQLKTIYNNREGDLLSTQQITELSKFFYAVRKTLKTKPEVKIEQQQKRMFQKANPNMQ